MLTPHGWRMYALPVSMPPSRNVLTPITPLARVLVAADAANGISAELPLTRWLSIPPGMATTLLREPVGEWVHLDARTQLAEDGLGLSSGVLSDEQGTIGEVAQPLLVRER